MIKEKSSARPACCACDHVILMPPDVAARLNDTADEGRVQYRDATWVEHACGNCGFRMVLRCYRVYVSIPEHIR